MFARDGINMDLGPMDPEDNWKIHVDDIIKKESFLPNIKECNSLQ